MYSNNAENYCSTQFVKKLMHIFDRSITSINDIGCRGSVISSRFLQKIAKKVSIHPKDYKNK